MHPYTKPRIRSSRAAGCCLVLLAAGAAVSAPVSARPLAPSGHIGGAYHYNPRATADLAAAVASQMDEGEKQRALALVNAARGRARTCGTRHFAAAPPLAWNGLLETAAQSHSSDMAGQNFFSHTGSDGSLPWQRLTAAGYLWSAMGENIAAGYSSVDAVVAAWLRSPGHCANIMTGSFREMGMARAVNSSSQYGTYWTLELATPRR